jgi:hypothetical protein
MDILFIPIDKADNNRFRIKHQLCEDLPAQG